MLTPVLLKNALGYDPLRLPYCGLIWDRLAGGGPSQGQRSPPPAPLDPSDDAGIEEAVLTFFGLPGVPVPIETACADQKSNFFHLLFSVKPNTPEKATGDWKQLAEESLENYVRKHCAEGVLVQAVHDNILRLEVAIQFSGQGRCKKFLRESLRNRILRKSLPGSPDDWDVTSKYLSQAEGARHAISGGAGGAGGGGAVSGICARPAAGDGAKFFSVTITVKQAEPCGGDRSWIDKITGAVEKHVSRNSAEALLVQSVAGGCLTLSGAMRYDATRNGNDLQQNLRARQVMTLVPPGVGDGDVTCTVSARSEDERHAVYETLRRMAAAAGPGEAGQAQPGPF